MKKILLFILIFSLFSISSFSQDVITKKDGTQIKCSIVKEDSSRVYIVLGHFENKRDSSIEKNDIASLSGKEKPNGKFTDRSGNFTGSQNRLHIYFVIFL